VFPDSGKNGQKSPKGKLFQDVAKERGKNWKEETSAQHLVGIKEKKISKRRGGEEKSFLAPLERNTGGGVFARMKRGGQLSRGEKKREVHRKGH